MSDLVDTLAKLDVIEPLTLAAYQVASGGGWTKIEFLRNSGWSGYEVEKELKRFSIPIHGRGFTKKTKEHPEGTLFCYVKREQSRWAEYILRRARVPVLTVVDVRNATWAEGHDGPVPQWDNKPSRAGVVRNAGSPPPLAVSVGEKSAETQQRKGGFQRLIDWLVEGE